MGATPDEALQTLIHAATEFDAVADYDHQIVDGYVAFALAEAVSAYLSSIGN
jgi:hypothetical protein